jgi:ComF family protein
MQTAILKTKRPLGQPLLIALAEMLAYTQGAEMAAWAPDALVPVPLHWRRRFERGTNGAELLAARLAPVCGAQAERLAVRRCKDTLPQGSISPRQRLENVRGAFRINARFDWRGARVLIVDDVMTTGATANEIARLLKKAGARTISVAVLARGTGLARGAVPARGAGMASGAGIASGAELAGETELARETGVAAPAGTEAR